MIDLPIHKTLWTSAFEPILLALIFSLVDGVYDKGISIYSVFQSVIAGISLGILVHIFFWTFNKDNDIEYFAVCIIGLGGKYIITRLREMVQNMNYTTLVKWLLKR